MMVDKIETWYMEYNLPDCFHGAMDTLAHIPDCFHGAAMDTQPDCFHGAAMDTQGRHIPDCCPGATMDTQGSHPTFAVVAGNSAL
jgi:hypothetical protein